MSDLGFTHVALVVQDVDASIAFYARYANMQVVHRRDGEGRGQVVAWITDGTRPFVIVLIQQPGLKDRALGPIGHLGVALATRADVDQLAAEAREAGILLKGPEDWGPPVGYWAYIADPDGNVLEVSHGQEVALAVENEVAQP